MAHGSEESEERSRAPRGHHGDGHPTSTAVSVPGVLLKLAAREAVAHGADDLRRGDDVLGRDEAGLDAELPEADQAGHRHEPEDVDPL
jgi:hypothetical protein